MAFFNQEYVNPNQEQILGMKEKFRSLSGDSFDIKNSEGTMVFKGNNKLLTMRDTKIEMTDWSGRTFAYIKTQTLSLRGGYYISDADDNEVLLTCKPSHRFGSGVLGALPGGDMKVYTGKNGSELAYHVTKQSGLLNKVYKVEDANGNELGTIGQTNKLQSMIAFFGTDCYEIKVNPGADAGLLVVLGIVIDDCKEGEEST